MRSIKFPQMFNTNSTNIWKETEHLEATKQNTTLLLHCEKGELFCDPYFGLMLKHFIFNQNNEILKEALTDMIYNQVALFIPQLRVNRNDIRIIAAKEFGKVYCTISGINQIDYTPNTYNLLLFEDTDD